MFAHLAMISYLSLKRLSICFPSTSRIYRPCTSSCVGYPNSAVFFRELYEKSGIWGPRGRVIYDLLFHSLSSQFSNSHYGIRLLTVYTALWSNQAMVISCLGQDFHTPEFFRASKYPAAISTALHSNFVSCGLRPSEQDVTS